MTHLMVLIRSADNDFRSATTTLGSCNFRLIFSGEVKLLAGGDKLVRHILLELVINDAESFAVVGDFGPVALNILCGTHVSQLR